MNLLDLMVKVGLDDQASEGVASLSSGISGKLATAGKVGAAAIGAVTAAAGATGAALINTAGEIAAYGDNIDKMSQKMGLTAEAYQEWDAVMQHSGTSMEAMKASMKTLANAAESGSEAFEQLGISQEQIASMSQQELFEATIAALQNVESETERTYLAGKTLGRGATELGALLNTSAEDTQAMRDRVHELGGVLSDEAVKSAAAYQDSLQDMQTALNGIKNNMMSEFLPSITQVMDGLQEVFSGDSEQGFEMISEGVQSAVQNATEIVPQALELGASILGGIIDGLVASTPALIESVWNSLDTLVSSILERKEELLNTGMEMLSGFLEGFQPEDTSAFIDTLTSVLDDIVTFLMESTPRLIESGGELFGGLITAVGESIPIVIDGLVKGIDNLVSTVVENAPNILNAALGFFNQILDALVQNMPGIIGGLIDGLMSLIDTVIQNAPGFLQAAAEFVLGLLTSIVQHLPEILAALAKGLLDLITSVGDKLPDMLKAGGEMIGGLITAIADALPDLLKGIGDLVQQGIDHVGDFISDMLEAGGNFIQGFIDGIAGAAGEIAGAVQNAIGGAVDTVKNFLGIASPSKLMRKMGTFTMEGFTDGIKRTGDDAVKAMEGVAERVYGAAKGEFDFSAKAGMTAAGAISHGSDTYNVYLNVEDRNDFNAMAREFSEALTMRSRMAGRASSMNVRFA